jgi:hypothetical protein
MEIPEYVNIEQSKDGPGPRVTVQDQTDAKQRAMWGMQFIPMHALDESGGLTMP